MSEKFQANKNPEEPTEETFPAVEKADPIDEVAVLKHESEQTIRIGEIEKEKGITWEELPEMEHNEDSFYRVVDESGYLDLLSNDVVRSSPTGTESNVVNGIDIGHRPTSFPAFDKGSPNTDYLNLDTDNYFIESQHPMYKRGQINPITNNEIKGRHWGFRAINHETGEVLNEIPPEHILAIYKKENSTDKIFIQKTSKK